MDGAGPTVVRAGVIAIFERVESKKPGRPVINRPPSASIDPAVFQTRRRSIPTRAASSTGGCASIARRARRSRSKPKIGCARVFNTRDQYEDAHYAAREMTVPVLDRQSGVPIRVHGVVPKMSLTPGRIWRGAPSTGEDTTDILAQMLGMSEAAVDKLYADGVVHRTEPFTEPQVAAVNP